MDIEFHYYMTHIIALRAGFNSRDAFTIAYASQYTDDNDTPYSIESTEGCFNSVISQTMYITKPQDQRLEVYPIFHFCPAAIQEIIESAPLRKDGTYHRLDTLPDNANAKMIFSDAIASSDLYRIGIAAHMYADTFCHRDFVGWKDPFNWMNNEGLLGGVFSELCPAIGHALAMHKPDIPSLVWEDTRLISMYRGKRNKPQILTAAGNIFDFFSRFTNLESAATVKVRLLNDLDTAIGEERSVDNDELKNLRMSNYEYQLGSNYILYDPKLWFNAAVDFRIDTTNGLTDTEHIYFWKEDYQNSDWYAFQAGVKAHKSRAIGILHETFDKMEIELN